MTTSKFFSIIVTIFILVFSASFALAEESAALESVCVNISIFSNGEYMSGAQIAEHEGWVNVTRWYSVGQSFEMYDLVDGNSAYFAWFDGWSRPYVETFGQAHVDIYSGAEANAMCNDDIDTGIYDGRINSHFSHMLASVYPSANGFDIYSYNPESGIGELDFTVALEDVEAAMAVAEEAHEWQLVASGSAGSFFAGTDGMCFVVSPNASGEMQTFSWNCVS